MRIQLLWPPFLRISLRIDHAAIPLRVLELPTGSILEGVAKLEDGLTEVFNPVVLS